MAHYTEDIRSRGVQSGVAHAPFDEALEILRSQGESIISIARNAQLRIQEGTRSYASQNGNYVQEGVIYIPNGKPKLVRVSPILNSARDATDAHRQGVEFYPPQSFLDIALIDSVEFPQKNIRIPTNRFNSEELIAFHFGGVDKAQAYGNFLDSAGIKEMPVWAVDNNYVKKQDKPFARQLWFSGLGDCRSVICGDSHSLHVDGRSRGVRE